MSVPYQLNDEQFESVLQLDAPRRYEHFLKRICDTERVYLLADGENPVVLTDETGEAPPQLPLWPHPRYAEAYHERFGGASWAEIGLASLLEDVLPGMAKEGVQAAALPTPDGRAPVVPAERLRDDILAYHDEWYGGRPT